jgi:hypothetical protein
LLLCELARSMITGHDAAVLPGLLSYSPQGNILSCNGVLIWIAYEMGQLGHCFVASLLCIKIGVATWLLLFFLIIQWEPRLTSAKLNYWNLFILKSSNSMLGTLHLIFVSWRIH